MIVFAVILAGCSDAEKPTAAPPSTSAPSGSVTPSETPSATPTTPAVDPDCVAGPGRTVQKLPAIQVPAIVVPPVTYTDKSGQQQTAVEGFTIPAQSIDAGCVVRYDAPGGCLGAIKISGAEIPPVTIPESTVAGTDKSFAAVTVPGVNAPAVNSPLVCQVENAGVLPTVTRKGVVRRGVARNGTARPGGRVKADGDRPEFRVESVKIPALRLPDVDVDPVRLESRKLPGENVDVFTGDDKVSYVAPGDVLFDTDQATIRPDAAKALHAIAAEDQGGPSERATAGRRTYRRSRRRGVRDAVVRAAGGGRGGLADPQRALQQGADHDQGLRGDGARSTEYFRCQPAEEPPGRDHGQHPLTHSGGRFPARADCSIAWADQLIVRTASARDRRAMSVSQVRASIPTAERIATASRWVASSGS